MKRFFLFLCIILFQNCSSQISKPMTLKDFTLTSEPLEAEIDGVNKTIIMKTYTAEVEALGEKVEIHFDPDNIKIDLEDYVNLVDKQLQWINSNSDFIHQKIVAEMLELKNSTWLDDGEKPLSEENFKQRIELETITFFEDGSYELYFKDGDIFFGHVIIASMDKENKVERVYMAG